MTKATIHSVTAKIPDYINAKLENLAAIIERTKGYIVRKAVTEYIEENEDYLISIHRLEQKGKRYTMDEVEKECDLEN